MDFKSVHFSTPFGALAGPSRPPSLSLLHSFLTHFLYQSRLLHSILCTIGTVVLPKTHLSMLLSNVKPLGLPTAFKVTVKLSITYSGFGPCFLTQPHLSPTQQLLYSQMQTLMLFLTLKASMLIGFWGFFFLKDAKTMNKKEEETT